MSNKKEQFLVKIDDKMETLTLVGIPGKHRPDYQYNTEGNKSAHRFPRKIKRGETFRTNGHRYEILSKK